MRQDATSCHQTDGRDVAGTASAAGRDTDPDNSMAMTRATRSFLHDTIQAVQAVGRRPALAAAAIGMLGLGIGATTAIFSLVHGVLVRPLPWPGADRIVQLREYRDEDRRGWRFAGLTNETFDAWQRSAATIEQLSAWSSRGVTLSGRGDPVRLRVVAATPSLFGLLGMTPLAGRPFLDDEGRVAAAKVAVLGHGLWQERFGGDPAVVGRTIQLDDEPYTVVGIARPDFYFPDRETALWIPLVVPPPDRGNPNERNVFLFSALARLKAGATPAQAAAEGTAVARRLAQDSLAASALMGEGGPPQVAVRPLHESVTGEIRPALVVLFAAVGVVLLIATANLANLLLAHGLGRRRELAVRAALGAGRGRLARQLLAETLVMGLAGGALGVLLAWAGVRLFPALAPPDFPRLEEIAVDLPVLAFALGVSIAASVLSGLAPALQGARVDLVRTLNEEGAATAGGIRRLAPNRLRAALLVVQIALAIVLLAGAGLLARSFVALVRVHPGYEPTGVLTARLTFPGPPPGGMTQGYERNAPNPARTAQALERLLERLRGLPQVAAAGSVNLMPLTPGAAVVAFGNPFGGDTRGPEDLIRAGLRVVSPGYLDAMGMRVVAGRAFTWSDTATAPPVLMVNEAFARRYLAGRRVVGAHLDGALEGPDRRWEIVGVVGDIRHAGLDSEPEPEVWVSFTQLQRGLRLIGRTVSLAVRTKGDPLAFVPTLRSLVRQVDPAVPVDDIMTMERRVELSVARPRFAAALLGALAAIGLLLAATGIYSVLAYAVTERYREIGVRTALGATPREVMRLFLVQGLIVTGIGLALGLAGARLAAPFLASLLYGVGPTDAATLGAVSAAVVLAALAAAILPARRAARVDPVHALRS